MTKPVIGILGAGKLGITLAKLGIDAGYSINISGSSDPEKISLSVNVIAKGANPMCSKEVIEKSNLIVLAMPLSKYQNLDKSLLKNKIIIDAMNYWWEIDGVDNIYYDENTTSTQEVQKYFNESHVVKAFNHMGYHDLLDESNSSKRKAIAYAGDDPNVYEEIATVISDFGFDPYFLGSLKDTEVLQPGGILFGVDETTEGIKKLLNK